MYCEGCLHFSAVVHVHCTNGTSTFSLPDFPHREKGTHTFEESLGYNSPIVQNSEALLNNEFCSDETVPVVNAVEQLAAKKNSNQC